MIVTKAKYLFFRKMNTFLLKVAIKKVNEKGLFFVLLVPGVAHRIKKKIILKTILPIFSLCYPHGTHGTKKKSANLVQQFGQL